MQPETIEDAYGNVTRIERDGQNLITAVAGPFGQSTAISNDPNGNPTRITNPAGEVISLSYSGPGQLVGIVDAKGNSYQFTMDNAGHVSQTKDPTGASGGLELTSAEHGFETSRKSALGRASSFALERPSEDQTSLTVTYPSGSRIQMSSLTDGSTGITSPPDNLTIKRIDQPDPRWGQNSTLLKSLSLTMPGRVAFTLNASRAVKLADSTDPLTLTTLTDTVSVNGQNYTRTFDATKKQVSWLSPAGRRTVASVDDHGRILTLQAPGMLPTTFNYDNRGRLTSFIQGSGSETRLTAFEYNTQGQIARITDPLKRPVRFEHDAAGRVTGQILPDGKETSFKYDADGNVASIMPPGQPEHLFDYTPINLPATYQPPDPNRVQTSSGIFARIWAAIRSFFENLFHRNKPGSTPHFEHAPGETGYIYNNDGQLTKVVRPDRTTTEFRYENGGRLSSLTGSGEQVRFGYDAKTAQLSDVTTGDGLGLSYGYDGPLLTRAAWAGPVKGAVSLTYDSNLRVASTAVDGGTPIKLKYDPDGLLTQAGQLILNRDSTSGSLASSALDNVTTAQEYNDFGELTTMRANFKNQELLSEQYEYDALGRIVRKTEKVNGEVSAYAYAYDSVGQLTDVTKNGNHAAHYDYDENGNRTGYVGQKGTINASYDAQDRIKQYGKTTFTSTANGEWLNNTAEGKTTGYSYDAFGNLRSVLLPDGAKIEYVIDGANRRVGKKINGKLVQGFLYQDQLKVIAELDAEGKVAARFVYGTRTNVPEYMIKGSKTYRLIADQVGSPRIVIDAETGSIAQHIDYEEFGSVAQDTNPGFQPFGFAGGIYDRDTKLIRFGSRDYDAFIGRWSAKDRSWRPSTDANLYAYATNDPINWIDQDGASPEDVPKIIGVPGSVLTGLAAVQKIYQASQLTGGTVLGGWGEWGSATLDAPASLVWGTGGAGAGASAGAGAALTASLGVGSAAAFGIGGGLAFNWGYNKWVGQSFGEQDADIKGPGGFTFGDWARCIFGSDASGCGDLFNWWHCHGWGSAGASGCGKGTGDIHMETFDGVRYDFQAAGEFLAMQDRAGRMKLQIRLEPDSSHRVSYCTAVSAAVDGANVAIHVSPQPQLYVNGQAMTLQPGRPVTLGKSGAISLIRDSWFISWPDGTRVSVSPSGGDHLDLLFSPGTAAGYLTGLLGNADGKPERDLVTRNGVALEGTGGFAPTELYGRFGESWRIRQSESLFHYAKGESTATFTDRTVPRENVTLASLDPAARAKAENECRAAGITAPGPLADCTLDLAVTGDRSYLLSASLAQGVPAQQQPTIATNSGLRLDMPSELVTTLWRWRVMGPGTPPKVVQELDANHKTVSLPAGEYQVASSGSGAENQWIVWPQKVQVQSGQQPTFAINSGLRLQLTAPFEHTLWHWRVVAFGHPDQVVEEVNEDHRGMILPPGDYQVASSGSGAENQWIVWPQKVQVKSGEQPTLSINSGIRFVGSGARGETQFQVKNTSGEIAQSWRSNIVQVFPPGKYSIAARSNASAEWKTIDATVVVKPGSITEVTVPAL
jgi:RHS repeat-associated protein